MRNNLSVLVPKPVSGTRILITIRVRVRNDMEFVVIQKVAEGKFGVGLFSGIDR